MVKTKNISQSAEHAVTPHECEYLQLYFHEWRSTSPVTTSFRRTGYSCYTPFRITLVLIEASYGCPYCIHAMTGIAPDSMPGQLSSTSFQIEYSLVNRTLDALQSELLTATLHKPPINQLIN